MADCSLPPPSPFLALPGEPSVPWIRWIVSFETYLLAANLDNVFDARKRALLLRCLGAEGQRVHRTFAKSTLYKDAVEHLEEHFAAPQSALLHRVSSGADTNKPVSLSPNTWLTCETWLAYASLMQYKRNDTGSTHFTHKL